MSLSGLSRSLCVAVGSAVLGAGLVPLATPALAAPSAPPVVAPEYGAFVPENPVLDWDPAAGAVTYRVQVSTSTSFTTTLYSADTYATRATPPADLPLGPLYWRVAGIDAAKAVGTYTQPALFTKTAAQGPVLLAPDDADSLVYPHEAPVLAWNGVPAVNSYVVTLADNDGFTGAKTFTTSSTQLALTEPLTPSKPYFWKVRGVSATTGVTTADSLVRTFRTVWPERPTPQAPVSGAAVHHVELSWSAVPGAKAYDVEVSPNGDFTNNRVALDGELTRRVVGTRFSPTATLPAKAYFWRVRAVDNGTAGNPGEYSEPVTFTLQAPTAPTQLRVDGRSLGTPVVSNPSFAWQGVPRAAAYELEVSTTPGFVSTETQTCTTMHTTYTSYAVAVSPTLPGAQLACPIVLSGGGLYYWRVRALDLHPTSNVASTTIPGEWSATSRFVYRQDVPSAASAQPGDPTTVLRWTPVGDFGRYRVTVTPSAGGASHVQDTYATSYTPLGSSATTAPIKPGSYTWTVRTLAHDGTLGPQPASLGSFTVEAPVTGSRLDILSPEPDRSDVDMPSMSWTPLTGAGHYRVYYAPTSSNTYLPLLPETQKLFFPSVTKHDTVLPRGSYKFYVQAFNSTDGLLGTSGLGYFAISDPINPAPAGPPTCAQTPDDVCEQADTPELSWGPSADATHYKLTLAADAAFTTKLREYTTQHRTLTPREALPDNQAGLSYYWFVQACKTACGPADADQAKLAAGQQSFRKRSLPVVQTAPADASVQTDQVHFSWQDWFDTNAELPTSSGARAYHLQVATDPSFNNRVDDVTVDQPVHTVWSKAYPDGVYYWRVQAVDGAAQGLTWSDTRTFTKTSTAPVADGSATSASALPTLRWSGLAHVGSYAVEVYRGVDSSFPSVNRVITATTKYPAFTPVSALPAGEYTWRVRKLDASGNAGPWSEGTPGFVVSQSAPSLLAPGNAATVTTNDLLFSWAAPMGPAAAAYRLETSTSPSFTTTVEAQRTVMTAWAPTAFYADGAQYYWRVRVLDGTGNVLATSVTRGFKKDATAPTVKTHSASAVPVVGPVSVTFDEPVKNLSTSSVKLRVAGTTVDLAGTVAGNGTTAAIFTPRAALVPGQKYWVVLGRGVTDAAGNPLVPVTLEARAQTVVESESPAVTNVWDSDSSSSADGGTYVTSATRGTSVTHAFSGTSISVLGHTGPDGGFADYYVDGKKLATKSSYSTAVSWKKPLFTQTLAAGAHTLKVVVTGTRPTGSSGTWVSIDTVRVGTTVVQDSKLVQSFVRTTNTAASGGSHVVASHALSGDTGGKPEFRFAFRGTTLKITGTQLPTGGQADVLVDGKLVATLQGWSSTKRDKVIMLSRTGLTDALHQVRVVVRGDRVAGSTGYDVALDTVGTT